MRVQTLDRDVYTTESLGESRHVTPEGFLLVRGVAIGRTGHQTYAAHELPNIQADAKGQIRIERLPEEVFREETIRSFEGKAVTIHHPDEFVTPENWKRYSVGIVQNVRRGEGAKNHLLLADLLIMSADGIAYANNELPQLSSGYDAQYDEIAPGQGFQRNILGNHVAMLPLGRCGPCCAIKDESSNLTTHFEEVSTMKNKPLLARLLASFGVKEPDAAAEVISQASEAAPHSVPTTDAQIAAASAQFTALQSDVTSLKSEFAGFKDLLAKLIPAEPAAPVVRTSDKALELDGEALTAIVSRAEILAPGITIPTNDALKTADGLKGLLVGALSKAIATTDGAAHVQPFLLGRDIGALAGESLLGVFNGAAEFARVKNNSAISAAGAVRNPFAAAGNPFVSTKDGAPLTTADRVRAQQQANADFWAKQKAS